MTVTIEVKVLAGTVGSRKAAAVVTNALSLP